MDDSFWKLIPANAVDPWDATAMHNLLSARQGRPSGYDQSQTFLYSGGNVASTAMANDSGQATPILTAGIGRMTGGRGQNFTPIPDAFQLWREHMNRGMKGLFDSLTDKPAPSMYFPVGKCLDRCATGRPESMEEFCKSHTIEGTRNRSRCWEAVEDLQSGNIGACDGRCRAVQHNWGR